MSYICRYTPTTRQSGICVPGFNCRLFRSLAAFFFTCFGMPVAVAGDLGGDSSERGKKEKEIMLPSASECNFEVPV